MLDDFDLKKMVQPLQNWFRREARVLPWRENPKPYYVWVSEIMLQQTRVEAVIPYFNRFVEELSDVCALASCPEDRLLKLWEGLGYYNRVRNLQAAAIQIKQQYGGKIPEEYEDLLGLKGIGHYTAGAIGSIAYGKPYPAVDGNVLRVLSRLTGDDSDIAKPSVRTHMEQKLEELMSDEKNGVDPGIFNQALMDLGATVCLPNGAPNCKACPWEKICLAHQKGVEEQLPVKSKAKERKIEKRTVFIIRDGDRVAIRKRPKKGLLAGLYELPNCEGHLDREEVLSHVEELGYVPMRVQSLEAAKHIFSHVEWQMVGYVVFISAPEAEQEMAANIEPGDALVGEQTEGHLRSGETEEGKRLSAQTIGELLFVEAADARERYAIPAAFARYAAYMNIDIGIAK